MRRLSDIAKEIRKDWTKPYFGAVPYIDAMLEIESINDMFYLDSADDIVMRFLVNAGSWRGETARIIKRELRELLKQRERGAR